MKNKEHPYIIDLEQKSKETYLSPFVRGEVRRTEGFMDYSTFVLKSSCASHHPSFDKGGQNKTKN